MTTSYQTGNPPYGLQYASPESPFFAQPFLGSLTGTVYPQPFPLTEPPTNVSRNSPDNSVNWSLFDPVSGAVGYYYKNPVPYALNCFLSVERQVEPNTVVTLDYIGSQAHHLVTLLSANPGNPALCLSLSQTSQVAPSSATCGPFGESNVYTTTNGTGVNCTLSLLGSNFGSDAWSYNYGNSVYNSLQVQIRHTARRLALNASYTYGKSVDDGSNLQEQLYPYDYRLRRGISSFDIRHNSVATYRYALPTDTFGGPSRLTKGWAVTGITRFSSGLPVTMIDYGDNSLVGTNNQGVNSSGVDLPDEAAGPLRINHHPSNGKPYINASLFPGEVILDESGNRVGSTRTLFTVTNGGGRAASALMSVAEMDYLFHLQNVVVVHHSFCGTSSYMPERVVKNFHEKYDADISTLFDHESLAISDFEESLQYDLELLRSSPAVPGHVKLYGFFYEINSGKLTEVLRDIPLFKGPS